MSPLLFIECKRDSGCVFNPYEAQLARENRRSSTSFFSLSVSSEDSPWGSLLSESCSELAWAGRPRYRDDLQPCQGTPTAGRSARQERTKRKHNREALQSLPTRNNWWRRTSRSGWNAPLCLSRNCGRVLHVLRAAPT